MRFLGHRDMMNIFHRAFIASALPMAFSSGFHPNPRISFGPPLPFGVSGLSECFDIVMNGAVALDAFPSINRWLPRGLSIKNNGREVSEKESLSTLIVAGKYVFLPGFDISAGELLRTIEETLCQKDIIVSDSVREQREENRRGKNIRPLIEGLRLAEGEGKAGLEAVLSMMPKATCRPSELCAGLFPGRRFEDFIIYRKECLKRREGTLESIIK
jgi:radical SAM-linked protein